MRGIREGGRERGEEGRDGGGISEGGRELGEEGREDKGGRKRIRGGRERGRGDKGGRKGERIREGGREFKTAIHTPNSYYKRLQSHCSA